MGWRGTLILDALSLNHASAANNVVSLHRAHPVSPSPCVIEDLNTYNLFMRQLHRVVCQSQSWPCCWEKTCSSNVAILAYVGYQLLLIEYICGAAGTSHYSPYVLELENVSCIAVAQSSQGAGPTRPEKKRQRRKKKKTKKKEKESKT